MIPRMWGGETTADELRRIANAVDKYKIPTVKVTGGQRIDLVGVKKEDLPAVEGHRHAVRSRLRQGVAHGENLRRLRVVSLWHPDSTPDGQGPRACNVAHVCAAQKVKFAVSGCPRNCAEAGIRMSV